MKRKALCAILILSCLLLLSPAASADGPYTLGLEVPGKGTVTARACDGTYLGNTYLSLTDLAAALGGTEKQFRFERVISSTDGEYFNISTGQSPVLAPGAESLPTAPAAMSLNPYRNRLFVDGGERRYYTHNPQNGDLYMSLTDIQLMLDFTVERRDGLLRLQLAEPFCPDPWALRDAGYFDMVDAALMGDADTGEILFSWNSAQPVPIASLTKLLSYVVLMEGIEAGEIRADDMVRITQTAEALSKSADGMVSLQAGTSVPFQELLEAMLIASSNESAVALAEHLCGSEGAFVARMRMRAADMNLSSVRLYNCSGLPSFSEDGVPVKRQNEMSAFDLFQLSGYILERYPGITAITSQKLAHFPSLNDYWTANSNPLLFNLEGVTGLKTGSTNRAGYCLTASLPVQAGGGTHTVVLILLGAETADVRGQAGEILLRWAKNHCA